MKKRWIACLISCLSLDEHQRKVIRRLTKSIVNQMTTDPINRIKEMAGTKQGDEALRMFTQIFALEDAVEMAAEKVSQSDATGSGETSRSP